MVIRIKYILFCLYLSSVSAYSCSVVFDGDEFLNKSHNKGITLQSTCFESDMTTNLFYGHPDKNCELIFYNANWLAEGWTFSEINGKGRFSAITEENSIKIIIKPKGGFTLKKVTLVSRLDIIDCDKIVIADTI